MIGSMHPQPASARGKKYGRPQFAAGRRLFALLGAGLVFVPLMFLSHVFGWGLLAWNGLVLVLYAVDLKTLPAATQLAVERSFTGVLNQLQPAQVTLSITNESGKTLFCCIVDSVPQSLLQAPPERRLRLPARASKDLVTGARTA